jgi:ATP-dependent DNA ligase
MQRHLLLAHSKINGLVGDWFVKDLTGVAALYLGKREGKDLVYMGKVGTGWSRTVSSQIRKQLDTVVSPKSKLTKPVKKPKATWVEPSFTAEVEYRDITSEGLLRQSSFKGLRRPVAGNEGRTSTPRSATRKQENNLQAAILAALSARNGKMVQFSPAKWRL